MNLYLLIAGILAILLGIFHSILGEYLIFRHKRIKGKIIPTKTSPSLSQSHLGIIWATWHLTSIFGWCLGAILIKVSFIGNEELGSNFLFIAQAIMYAIFTSSVLVLVGTKGRHPGWIVLLIIASLIYIGI